MPTDTLNAPLLLVAEDSAVIRTVLVRELKKRGFRTLTAENGNAALDLMRTYGKLIDGIVTDYSMGREGGQNGDVFLRGMAAEGIAPKPTVLYTAEPGNAIASMHDVLGVRDRSEYTDTPVPEVAQDVVVGHLVHLTKRRFSNPANGMTVHVVPKTADTASDVGGPDGIVSQLISMGIRMPPEAEPGRAVNRQ